jgi:hypothetical protein
MLLPPSPVGDSQKTVACAFPANAPTSLGTFGTVVIKTELLSADLSEF